MSENDTIPTDNIFMQGWDRFKESVDGLTSMILNNLDGLGKSNGLGGVFAGFGLGGGGQGGVTYIDPAFARGGVSTVMSEPAAQTVAAPALPQTPEQLVQAAGERLSGVLPEGVMKSLTQYAPAPVRKTMENISLASLNELQPAATPVLTGNSVDIGLG